MSVAGHRPVVLGNAMEGEPLSSKDAVLLHQAPGLVVDGLTLLGSALGAKRLVLATGPEVPSGPAEQAALGTSVEVLPLTGGFVAGQESALVNQVNGQLGVPSDPLVPVYRRGVDRRPTLVLNAETLAQLALLARYGADWFRAEGTTSDPGTFLATISGSSPTTLRHPGVLEVPRGAPLRSLLVAAGTDARPRPGGAGRRLPRRVDPRLASGDADDLRRALAVRRHARRGRRARARPCRVPARGERPDRDVPGR